jgi:hypothetical protein
MSRKKYLHSRCQFKHRCLVIDKAAPAPPSSRAGRLQQLRKSVMRELDPRIYFLLSVLKEMAGSIPGSRPGTAMTI